MAFKQIGILRTAFVVFAALALAATASAQPREAVVATANPHASEAAAEMLRRGGTAADAAIAAELVLGLVEPQSSGLGGGGFLLHFNGATRAIDAYDGREIAPAGATPTMFLNAEGAPMGFMEAVTSGRSIGAPSLVAMLKLAHDAHGRLPWRVLFEPAIKLADEGFAVSPRLNRLITMAIARGGLTVDPAARAYLTDADGAPLAVGAVLKNPAYAETLRELSRNPRALAGGRLARAIVNAAHADPIPGALTYSDLRRVKPRRLSPVCGPFRRYLVCSMPPPSSGGVAVIELLGLYARAAVVPEDKDDAEDWSAFLWASRLAYADRDFYVADDRFVPVPTRQLLARDYLDQRFREIDLARAPRGVAPGDPGRATGGLPLIDMWGRDTTNEAPGTTHMSIMDHAGNVVALTATVESVFGSQRMAAGFFLNNQLTDFSFRPEINGKPVANAVAPGKAPRSSMAPTIILTPDGNFYAAIGSPGGSAIIAYVARTIVGFTDWGLSMQDAIDVGHIIAAGPVARREARRVPAPLVRTLASRGWSLRESEAEDSGLHGLRVTSNGVEGGADPRREGVVIRVPPPVPAATLPAPLPDAAAAPTR
ncbi:MAG: gamma-glutamyltransferase family protein [Hyphomonadaceae bacterium]|nr:gamma-glutamyltransferase family protein [Hyphomonadaceae bacterium]